MTAPRRFPPPLSVEELTERFVIRDASGQALAYVYFEDRGRSSSDDERPAASRFAGFVVGNSSQNMRIAAARLFTVKDASSRPAGYL
jgi:hypothetical protein